MALCALAGCSLLKLSGKVLSIQQCFIYTKKKHQRTNIVNDVERAIFLFHTGHAKFAFDTEL